MLGVSSPFIEFGVVRLRLSSVLTRVLHHLAVENNSCLTTALKAVSDLSKVIHATFSFLLFRCFFLDYLLMLLVTSCYLISVFDAETTSCAFARKIFESFPISGVS